MNLQQLNWKIHLRNPEATQPSAWFKVFNTWIPDAPEVFIDVADYSHVGEGPVTLLAGHAANFSLDNTGSRLGLLLDRRQPEDGSNTEKLRSGLLSILKAAVRLETDATLAGSVQFDAGDLKLVVNNRAVAPNDEATFSALKLELAPVLDSVYGAGAYTLSRDLDPKQRLTVHVKAKASPATQAALAKLG